MPFPPPTERQSRIIWFALTTLAVAVVAALLVGLIWGLGKVLGLLSPVLWPLAIAAVVAYLLDPLVDYFERLKIPRARAIILVFIIAFGVVTSVLSTVVPRVVVETRELASKVPEYSSKLQQKVEGWIDHPPNFLIRFLPMLNKAAAPQPGPAAQTSTNSPPVPGQGQPAAPAPVVPGWSGSIDQKTLASATSWLASVLPEVGKWLFGQVTKVAAWFGVLAGVALIPVYAFYLLLEKRGIAANWTDYLPVRTSSFKEELIFVLRAINDYLIAFFRGQVLVALCDGVLYTIGFFALGLNYAFLLGFLATLLTMIPFLGAITTCVFALVLAIVQYGDWLHPALVLAVFAVVQTLEGLFISPKVMGDRVGLHPLSIIIAVMAGTTLLGGILGGILAIPLTAALRVIMFRYVWKKRKG